jgi:hypothetical protein
VDHIRPIACGGVDAAWNMQYQTTEDAKAKDKWEIKVCRAFRNTERETAKNWPASPG